MQSAGGSGEVRWRESMVDTGCRARLYGSVLVYDVENPMISGG